MDKRLVLLLPLTFGIAFFLGMESGGFQLVLLQVAKEFALDPVLMGGVVTSQFIAIFLGPLLFGWISDRIGKKIVLAFSMVFYIVGCFGAFLSPTILFFSCSLFSLGLGYSVCECIGSSLLSDSFPGKESSYLNFMQSGFSLGAVLSPLVFSRLINAGLANWRTVFLCAGLGYVLLYPLLILYRNEKANETGVNHQKAAMPSAPEQSIFSRFFIVLFFSIMICVAVEVGAAFFADSLFVTEFGNNYLGAYAISGFWLSMAVSRFAFSRIKMKPETMVMAGFLMICLALIISLPLKNPNISLAVFFFLGFASGPIWPVIIGIGATFNPKRSGTNTSILYASGGLGGVIMPVLIGLAAEYYGFYSGFWLLAVISASGFLIMWLGTRKHGESGKLKG